MKLLSSALIIIFSFFYSSISAQTVTGEWYGVGHTKKNGAYNNYLVEMVLKQKGSKVTGVIKYFFKSDSIKVKVTGTYATRYRRLELNASPILNFQAKNSLGADCPMEGGFTLKVSAVKSTLTGQFNPTYDYRLICPAIDIQFTKDIPPKEEPIEEDKVTDTLPKAPVVDTIKQKPAIKDTAVKRIPEKPIVTIKDAALPVVVTKAIDPRENFIKELNKRSFELVAPVIEVDADSLFINFYDNGEIDNDTISVFYNRNPMLMKKMLSKQPLTLHLPLDTAINEISMFADNLGSIPPNTAVAIIYAGEQRFELNLTSSYLKNAVIRFKRKSKVIDPKNIN